MRARRQAGPDERFETGWTHADEVQGALTRLTPEQREAIALAYFGGYTYREVAAFLHVPEGTIKNRIRTGFGAATRRAGEHRTRVDAVSDDRLGPDERRELLGPYALGALDPDERAEVERLVAEDAAAGDELRGYQRVAARLRLDDGPSPDVWDRIRQAITAEDDTPVVPIDAGPARRRWRGATRTIVAAAAAAAVVAVAVWGGVHLTSRSTPSQPISALRGAAEHAAGLRDARHLTVTSPDGGTLLKVVVLADGRGYVLGGHLLRTVPAEIYALFATTPGQPVLVAVLGTALHVTEFHVPASTLGLALGQTTGRGQPVLAVGSAPLPAPCRGCAPTPLSPVSPPAHTAPTPAPRVETTVPTTLGRGSPPLTLPTLPLLPIHLP